MTAKHAARLSYRAREGFEPASILERVMCRRSNVEASRHSHRRESRRLGTTPGWNDWSCPDTSCGCGICVRAEHSTAELCARDIVMSDSSIR